MANNLSDHLATGTTQICHCWRITRKDGAVQGFTDHDGPISFDGTLFEAESGLTASAMETTGGLSSDNGEVAGALSSDVISEDLLRSGAYDEADLEIWQVHWPDPSIRALRFRGSLGEMTIAGDAFTVELRGLSDLLTRPFGRVIQSGCSAVFGDSACGINLDDPAYFAELSVVSVDDGRALLLSGDGGINEGWFERGRLSVISGSASGSQAAIKRHKVSGGQTRIALWEPLRIAPEPGDLVRCEVGCDKRLATCRDRFANLLNFRGFPHVPGDDWLMAYPRNDGNNTGGSLDQ